MREPIVQTIINLKQNQTLLPHMYAWENCSQRIVFLISP
nr:MAG TPA: hypothetical protein [Caudoviricetes sp.]